MLSSALTNSINLLAPFPLTSLIVPSGIMVRLMLVAAPAFVLLSAIALSTLMKEYCKDFREGLSNGNTSEQREAAEAKALAAATAASHASKRKGVSK